MAKDGYVFTNQFAFWIIDIEHRTADLGAILARGSFIAADITRKRMHVINDLLFFRFIANADDAFSISDNLASGSALEIRQG